MYAIYPATTITTQITMMMMMMMMMIMLLFLIKYNFDRSTTLSKLNPIGVRTHDLQIMTVHFMSLRRLL